MREKPPEEEIVLSPAELEKKIQKGKVALLCMFGIIALLEFSTIAWKISKSGLSAIIFSSFRVFVEGAVMIALYNGKVWARILWTIFCVAGLIVCLSVMVEMPNPWTILIGLFLLVMVGCLWVPNPVAKFLDSQR
ncbi:MAG: hypothetical protein V1809_16745 [Planctomycetota bacterium]